jgi:5-formyltetrahydrofolate cyclo-ligase
MQPQKIRQHYRHLRKNLSYLEQQSNAQCLADNINNYLSNYKRYKIAAYLAVQGEISLSNWIASQLLHSIYLPKLYEPIHPNLRFAPITEHTTWVKNRFNIIEPKAHWGETLHSRELDIILVPLVAFDRSGNRIGMGAGYYDRALAFKRARRHYNKPILIGVAHSIQEHSKLISNKWDIGMDCIITEKEIIQPTS